MKFDCCRHDHYIVVMQNVIEDRQKGRNKFFTEEDVMYVL